MLNSAIRPQMQVHLASVLAASEHICVRVGVVQDHVHIAVLLSRKETVARAVEKLKKSSSQWIRTQGPEFARFSWQRGYAVFSVGLTDRDALVRYVDHQAALHARRDFQAEMRSMFTKYGIAFDERFVWD